MAIKPRLRIVLFAAFLSAVACGPSSPAELLTEAREAAAAGELATAEIHLRNLLQREPDHREGRLLLGQISVELGNFAAAEAHLRRAEGLGADRAAYFLPLLRSLGGQSRHEELLEEAASAPELSDSERFQLLQLTGIARRALGDTASAEADFRRALVLEPASVAVRTQLADLLLTDGRPAQAARLIAGALEIEPDYGPALVVRGQLERASGDMASAEASFVQVADSDTGSTAARSMALAQLAELLLARGDIEEASRRADQLLASIPGNPLGSVIKARIEIEQGELDAAETRLEDVVSRFPNFMPATLTLGVVNARQGQFGQAEMYLTRAAADDPEAADVRLALINAYLQQDKTDLARELISDEFPAVETDALMYALAARASLQGGNEALAAEYFDRSEEAATDSVEQLLGLASVYLLAEETERAARVFEGIDFEGAAAESAAAQFLALTAPASGGSGENAVSAGDLAASLPAEVWPQALLGAVALRVGDAASSNRYLSEALETAPDQIALLIGAARARAALGDADGTAAALRRITEIDPAHSSASLMLAELSLRRGEVELASDLLADLPDSAAKLRLQGTLAMAEGRPADGAARFAEAYALEPSPDNALLAHDAARRTGAPEPERFLLDEIERSEVPSPTVLFMLGTHTLAEGDFAAATAHFEAVLEQQPNFSAALNNLAWLYGEAGDDRALEMARRAYSAAPDSGEIADTLGWLLAQEGNPDGALPFLRQAAAGLPDNPAVRYHLAVALEESGDAAGALDVLDELIASDADFAERDDAARRRARLSRD